MYWDWYNYRTTVKLQHHLRIIVHHIPGFRTEEKASCEDSLTEVNGSIISEYPWCPIGLLDIFIYFIFDIILCVLVEFHYRGDFVMCIMRKMNVINVHFWTYLLAQALFGLVTQFSPRERVTGPKKVLVTDLLLKTPTWEFQATNIYPQINSLTLELKNSSSQHSLFFRSSARLSLQAVILRHALRDYHALIQSLLGEWAVRWSLFFNNVLRICFISREFQQAKKLMGNARN